MNDVKSNKINYMIVHLVNWEVTIEIMISQQQVSQFFGREDFHRHFQSITSNQVRHESSSRRLDHYLHISCIGRLPLSEYGINQRPSEMVATPQHTDKLSGY